MMLLENLEHAVAYNLTLVERHMLEQGMGFFWRLLSDIKHSGSADVFVEYEYTGIQCRCPFCTICFHIKPLFLTADEQVIGIY